MQSIPLAVLKRFMVKNSSYNMFCKQDTRLAYEKTF